LAAKAAVLSVSVANGVRALAVLVVEDDFFVRCDVAGCLREAGYTVIETESGEAAIALCKSEMTIDMVLTDINLGGTATGWDVAKRFRSEQPDMPVVYMSAQAIDRDRCVPGSVFVAKPYQHIDILSGCASDDRLGVNRDRCGPATYPLGPLCPTRRSRARLLLSSC
jgi:CheY-like chemotaxis protein